MFAGGCNRHYRDDQIKVLAQQPYRGQANACMKVGVWVENAVIYKPVASFPSARRTNTVVYIRLQVQLVSRVRYDPFFCSFVRMRCVYMCVVPVPTY